MNPKEHGEVFVLNDGGEVNLDHGNHERYEIAKPYFVICLSIQIAVIEYARHICKEFTVDKGENVVIHISEIDKSGGSIRIGLQPTAL